MMAECGFDQDVALVVAGALAEQLNETYGDSIDPALCVAAVKQFIASDVDIKCRHCGWRRPGTKFCTFQGCQTGDADKCGQFRHVFEVVRK